MNDIPFRKQQQHALEMESLLRSHVPDDQPRAEATRASILGMLANRFGFAAAILTQSEIDGIEIDYVEDAMLKGGQNLLEMKKEFG